MKIILFFNDFDPIHNGHLKIAMEALKSINGDKLYYCLNKGSKSKKLTSYTKRKKMIELAIEKKKKFAIIDIDFDNKNIYDFYKKILEFCNDDNEYYLLIEEETFFDLNKYYISDYLKEKFKFIIITKENNFDINSNYIYLNKKSAFFSSEEIKEGNYKNIDVKVKNYIIKNNLYLEKQIKKYLSKDRYKHVISVKKLALKIFKNNKKELDKNKIITATLLHDIAKEYQKDKTLWVMRKYYPDKLKENPSLYHQYVGEYLAKKKFHIEDEEILKAIKYHTTANEKLSKLAKLVYVSDKLDPLRDYDSSELINQCIDNLDKGFIMVLKDNIEYFKLHNIKFLNEETTNAINYYLKEEI